MSERVDKSKRIGLVAIFGGGLLYSASQSTMCFGDTNLEISTFYFHTQTNITRASAALHAHAHIHSVIRFMGLFLGLLLMSPMPTNRYWMYKHIETFKCICRQIEYIRIYPEIETVSLTFCMAYRINRCKWFQTQSNNSM